MTLFVIVTAVLNIALGYALAIYLDHARRPFRAGGVEGDPLAHLDEFSLASIGESTVEAPSASPTVSQATSGPKAGETVATPTATPTPATVAAPDEGVEMERDMLAGIEEFRNQLAQMKAAPAEAPAAAGV